MKTFVICDDEALIRDELEKELQGYAEEEHLEFSIVKVDSAEALMGLQMHYDVLFLDIHLPGMNGYEVAKSLQRKGINPSIIIITTEKDDFQEAFKIQAKRYLLKPFQKEELYEALKEVLPEEEPCIQIALSGISVVVPVDVIMYLEAKKTFVKVVLNTGNWGTINQSLKKLEGSINRNNFVCPRKGFMVNKRYMDALEGDSLKMNNGFIIKVSARNYRSIKKYYMQECLRRGLEG